MSGKQHARGVRWAIAWALGIALTLAALSFHLERARSALQRPASEPTTPVVVATVEHRDVRVELTGVGTVEAYHQVTVKPRINGQITALDFMEGTSVRPGQVLARLDDRLLAAQLQQAQGARLGDEASLADAEKRLARATSLAPQGYVSRNDLDTFRSQVAVLQATIAADRAAVRTARVQTRLTSTQYQYSLQDADTAELYHWAPLLTRALEGLPQLRDVVTDLEPDSPHASVVVDRQTAARLGITTQQIDDTLYDAFGQRQVATLYTAIDQFHVILEVPPQFSLNTGVLRSIYLRSAEGSLVPLSAMSRVVSSAGPQSINHEGQFPAVTLSFNLAAGVSLGEAVQAVQAARQRLGLPPSVRASFQGTAQAFKTSLAGEPYLILAAVLAVYIVLGVLYESTLHPVTILSTLPSAGAGALAALMLTGNELDAVSPWGSSCSSASCKRTQSS